MQYAKYKHFILYKNKIYREQFHENKFRKNNKIQKKNDLQFVDSKKNLKFAHLFGGEIVFIHK